MSLDCGDVREKLSEFIDDDLLGFMAAEAASCL